MYKFQVKAPVATGESIGLVGSTSQLGKWDVSKYLPLRTNGDGDSLWWIELNIEPSEIQPQKIEYKYLRLKKSSQVEWEPGINNRWIPLDSSAQASTILVEDGDFGKIPSYPYGYFEQPEANRPEPTKATGGKVLVLGSSVALGCSAWLLKGWASLLGEALQQKYGHKLVNRSIIGANIGNIIDCFPQIINEEKPDFVIISLSLGNEGFAYCPHRERVVLQQRFEHGLQQLIKTTQKLGIPIILGGLYPHGEYTYQHNKILQETREKMLSWRVPILDWLPVLDNGRGKWKRDISFDVAHPNSKGHQLMFEQIDLNLFDLESKKYPQPVPYDQNSTASLIFNDLKGFRVYFDKNKTSLKIINSSPYTYQINPTWYYFQRKLQTQADLKSDIYINRSGNPNNYSLFFVPKQGNIETHLEIPPSYNQEYIPISDFVTDKAAKILFNDEFLKIFSESDNLLALVNLSSHEYNIQPMWEDVRIALKTVKSGVYEQVPQTNTPFRTLMIGENGLESRVKIPPKSLVYFKYQCELSQRKRIALVPLGDRCAPRMLLYKMGYDGPALPFDLTRTTNLKDVADIIINDFQDMWNPSYLHYNHEEKRIYHSKWWGLSFAHEIEDTDNPQEQMKPIFERMENRYGKRSERFRYILEHADELIFIRTGPFHRDCVRDLVAKLQEKYPEKPFTVLLISPQSQEEISPLPHVVHYSLEFNPEKMCENHDYWQYCSEVMSSILKNLGVTSKNLFWCPPKVQKIKLTN